MKYTLLIYLCLATMAFGQVADGTINESGERAIFGADEVFSFTMWYPTNDIPWSAWVPPSQSCTLTQVIVRAVGATGTVDIVKQNIGGNDATYETIASNIVLNAVGTTNTTFSDAALTINEWLTVITSDLSGFDNTNRATVVVRGSVP